MAYCVACYVIAVLMQRRSMAMQRPRTPAYLRAALRSYDLITAFEVFEHLSHPSVSLAGLFHSNPRFIIASTEIYSGQDVSWWYLTPHQGQHVFFYSRDALRSLASRHHYSYYEISGRYVFAREPLTRYRLWACRNLLRGDYFNYSEQPCRFPKHGPGFFEIRLGRVVSLYDHD